MSQSRTTFFFRSSHTDPFRVMGPLSRAGTVLGLQRGARLFLQNVAKILDCTGLLMIGMNT
jgi:hypothetical protein